MSSIGIDADLVTASVPLQGGCLEERRREARYAPLKDRVYLGWWVEEDFHTETGLLCNISSGGAAIRVTAPIMNPETLWVCVVGPARQMWVAGRIKGQERGIVRIEFFDAFPYELFKEVVWNLPHEEPLEPVSDVGDAEAL